MQLKELIKNAEDRHLFYKGAISHPMYRDLDKDCLSLKNLLRDLLNDNKKWLKDLKEEQEYINQGLNPPYFYHLPRR